MARDGRASGKGAPWLVSPLFDGAFFILPGVLGLAAVIPSWLGMGPVDTPVWAWLTLVLAVDVAHVWATLYRVYLNPVERRRRPLLYGGTPIVAFAAMYLIYTASPALFWTALAYLAVYHFVKQQRGFVALYQKRGGCGGDWARRLDSLAVYTGTLVPVAYWHTHLPRSFSWFIEGDFLAGLPVAVMDLLWPVYYTVGAAWLVMRGVQIKRGGWNPGGDAVMLLTWANWYVGIVALDMDFTFTATNVLLHGVPYVALVWAASDRGASPTLSRLLNPRWALAFVGLLLVAAWAEEGLWDALVWQEHPQVFGDWSALVPHTPWLAALAIPLLSVPQVTHYILDGFIWKMDGSNPGLAERLFGPKR